MNKIRKARREPGEARANSAGNADIQIHPQYSPSRPNCQSIKPLSILLDQALSRAEYHSDLANFHHLQAEKHRKVLRSLQGLIPHYQFKTEGDLFNGR